MGARVLQPGATGTATLPLNTWTHLAATYDGASIRVHVNGSEVGSAPLTGSILTSSGSLRFGGNSIWNEWFKGRLDDIRIYSRALGAAEIQADMNRAVTATTL